MNTGPRDIVAQGRTHTKRAIALLLIPHFAIPLNAFVAGNLGTAGIETARLVVWIGFLYLVYLGFRLVRVIVAFYAITVIALAAATIIRTLSDPSLLPALLALTYMVLTGIGIAIIVLDPAVRVFFKYQRGGQVPYPEAPEPPRRLTSA